MSNFIADVFKIELGAQICILNNGTIRSNCLIEKGKLTIGKINDILSIFDILVVK